VTPAEKKFRIVPSVLRGEISIAKAARRQKVSEQAIGNCKRQFLEGGKAGIETGKAKPSTRKQQLEDEVAELTQALGEAAVEIRVWKKSAEGRWALRGPRGDPHRGGHVDFEVLRSHRHARTDLAALAGEGEAGPRAEGAVAAIEP